MPLETLLMNDGQGYQPMRIVGAEVWDPDSNYATWRCSHRVGSVMIGGGLPPLHFLSLLVSGALGATLTPEG